MIKQLEPSEFTAAAEVIRASFATVADDLGLTEENCPRYVGFVITPERLQTQHGWGWHIFGFYDNGRLIGYASVSKEDEGVYELHNLAVLPEFRHMGYGRQLVDFCVETVIESGGSKVNISIVEENIILKNWYIDYGFIHTGTKRFDHLSFTVGYMEIALDAKDVPPQEGGTIITHISDFDEYKRLGEPEKTEKSGIWQTAIGLQQVDGLTPSDYLIKAAKQNIEGELTIYEVQERLNDYYKAKPDRTADDRTEEADKVSSRIAEILSERTFSFSPAEYITLHKRLFTGIYQFAGKIRDYNISKEEWVLNGNTVYYASAYSIRATLDYDFEQERSFVYKGLDKEQIVEHIAKFVSGLWQIHVFGEGNTRTTAVFTIKYLRSIGFTVTNDLFAGHSWYFRNALVRANYNDYKNNIYSTLEYLKRFFENLLFSESHLLKNRDMLVPIISRIDVPVKAGNVPVNDKNVPIKVPVTRRTQIIKKLSSDPGLTSGELAAMFSVSEKTIKRDFAALKNDGKIMRVGSDKKGLWEIIE